MSLVKNQASQKWMVFAFDATTGVPLAGDAANISAYISKDWATAAGTNDAAPTEVDATNAVGYYTFDLTAAETNADVLNIFPTSSTSNIEVVGVPGTIYTDDIKKSILRGTVTSGDTTSLISDIAISTNNQLVGRAIIFDDDTTTANLQGQYTDITGGTSATNTLSFTALTDNVQNGDTFRIV